MIVIDDPSVSNRHAQLELSGETYRLKDLDSTNGTKVNGVPITETALRFEDRIRFGAIEARFELDVRGSQPLPQREIIEAKPAESSAAPSGFGKRVTISAKIDISRSVAPCRSKYGRNRAPHVSRQHACGSAHSRALICPYHLRKSA